MTTIKVLGSGCKNCQMLEERVREAANQLGLEAQVEHVRDYTSILAYGATSTPGLVVDERLVSAGRVPAVSQIKEMLSSPR